MSVSNKTITDFKHDFYKLDCTSFLWL